jgi:hypothetical protein
LIKEKKTMLKKYGWVLIGGHLFWLPVVIYLAVIPSPGPHPNWGMVAAAAVSVATVAIGIAIVLNAKTLGKERAES